MFTRCLVPFILLAGLAAAASAAAGQAPGGASLLAQPTEFGTYCSVCHGDGTGTDRGPALIDNRRLRSQSEAEIANLVRNGRNNMPPFATLRAEQIASLAAWVHSLNAAAIDMKPAGDIAAGESFFFGAGGCGACHQARGRGEANGPDLSAVGRQLSVADLDRAIRHPPMRTLAGWDRVVVTMRDGAVLRGFARVQSAHSAVLQTADERLHLLSDAEYTRIEKDATPSAPPLAASDAERRDLMAFLATLGGVVDGIAKPPQPAPDEAAISRVMRSAPGDWPTYNGRLDGNRYSAVRQIDADNVATLAPAWLHPLPYSPLETTPIVVDGVMYVTGPNQVYALDGRTGNEIWSWSRPRSSAEAISGDAAKGAQRGVAILGDRVFFITDNAHMVALHRLTGALLWDVAMPGREGKYGGTSAPLVVNDLVIGGVSGGDEGIRGFVAAYRASTGEEVWRFWTVPAKGDPEMKTWETTEPPMGGATWLSGSYDQETGLLFWSVGNPYPDTDGDNRGGDNLYSNSDIALDAKTGKLKWWFQFTPHDLHDWDANQPIVLVDAPFKGRPRKLLLHANRNGFFYVLDRTTGQFLQGTAFVKKLTWASGIDSKGRPIKIPGNQTTEGGVKTCPAVRGATNWYSTAFDPATQLYYVMSVEDCTIYRKQRNGGYAPVVDQIDPAKKVLRALMPDSGKVAWEVPMKGSPEKNYSGVLATAGGIVFFGETSGGFAAADSKSGRILWRFESNETWKGSPMTYSVAGRQYVAIASGPNIIAFAIPAK